MELERSQKVIDKEDRKNDLFYLPDPKMARKKEGDHSLVETTMVRIH
jgi:hypothetical protein